MQDIADACGFSRNTVSKVFNGRGSVPAATREIIIRTAAGLGYNFPAGSTADSGSEGSRTIALFTGNLPSEFHFGTYFMTAFTDQLTRSGYSMKIFEVSAEELRVCRLPIQFDANTVAGIIGIELFNRDYLEMLCRLNLPTIMVDGPMDANSDVMTCDFIAMENVASVTALVRTLLSSGAKQLGFVGDRYHCESFFERWIGFTTGLERSGLAAREEFCILAEDSAPYNQTDWLISRLDEMPYIPDAFICANDYLAVHLISALKKKGLNIPNDVQVTGFDGTLQSTLAEPPLTTVRIPSSDLGRMAADFLLQRKRHPEIPFHWTHIKTEPVWRGSTRKQTSVPETEPSSPREKK